MNMFDDGNDKDQEMKDQILQGLVEHMEQILSGGMKGRAGLGVEVQAEDPESLKAGLEQAKGAVDDHADELSAGGDDEQKLAHGGMVLDRTDLEPHGHAARHKASSHETLPRTDLAPGGEHAGHTPSSHETLPRHPDTRFAHGGEVEGGEDSDLMRLKEMVEREEEEEKNKRK